MAKDKSSTVTKTKKKRGFGSNADMSSAGGKDKFKKFKEKVQLVEYPKNGKTLRVRLIQEPSYRKFHKVPIKVPKWPVFNASDLVPVGYDAEENEIDESIEDPIKSLPNHTGYFEEVYINLIDRDAEKLEPKRITKTPSEVASGFMDDKDSDAFTPARALRMTYTLQNRIRELTALNVHDGEERELYDPKYGRDILIKYDPDASGASMYGADLVPDEGCTPLTKKDKKWLLWDLESNLPQPMSLAAATKEAVRLEDLCPQEILDKINGGDGSGSAENNRDDFDDEGKGKKKVKKNKGQKASDDEPRGGDDAAARRAERKAKLNSGKDKDKKNKKNGKKNK